MRPASLAAALALGACAAPPFPPPAAYPVAPRTPYVAGVAPQALAGWMQEDHLAAFRAFRETCHRAAALAAACSAARLAPVADPASARRFFEARFVAQPVDTTPPGGVGLLTGYFSPEYAARAAPDEQFSAAVRSSPAERLTTTRAEIEASPLAVGGLAYLRPEELFFLQIQGSGTLVFPDGSRRRAVYAADNGHPFVGIARTMRERGLLADNQTSGDAIRAWLAAHRGPEAQAVMNANPRYIFFALQPDDGREPAGAAGLPLPPGRAIAVDAAHHDYGGLMWIDAQAPALAGAFPAYRRLVMALDTGGAIKGPVRADLYLGRGDEAGAEAGRIRHELRMFRLIPRP